MKKSKFAESQIIGILKQQETGRTVADFCRKHGINQATFYNWKTMYSGLEVNQLKKLKELEAELAHYKRTVADQALQITVLKDVVEKALWPAEKRELVDFAHQEHKLSLRQAFGLFGIQPSVYYYKPKPDQDQEVRD